jgi:hypothetical protein
VGFFKELLKQMDFVEILEHRKLTPKEKRILDELDKAADFVNKYNRGKAKAKPINQVLNEL